MTAYRIVTDHEELDNVGQLTHAALDDYVLNTAWMVVSGASGPVPPDARFLSGGLGITLTDNGPGNSLVISAKPMSGSALDPTQHELLLQLVHLADEDGPRGSLWASGYVRTQGPFPFPTASIWWTDSTLTKRFMQQVVARNSMQLITTSSWQVFEVDGVTVADSFTDVITYSGAFETSRTRSTP